MPVVPEAIRSAPREVTLSQYVPYPLTQAIHASMARFRMICAGRRIGKSTFAIAEALKMLADVHNDGLKRPHFAHRPRGVFMAPTYDMVFEDWLMTKQLLRPLIREEHASRMSLDLGALGDLEFKSAEAKGGAGRGAGYDFAICDEASRIPEAAWESDLRPALSDRQGRAILISTPFGKNWFYDLYRRGMDGEPDYASWRYPTIDGWRSRFAHDPDRLLVYEKEWEDIRRTTSERNFQQEYLADFLENEGQFLTTSKCLRGLLRPAIPGRSYLAGIDIAKEQDWMVTLIGEVESRQVVGLIRSQRRSWDAQKATSISLLQQYPNVHCYLDSTGVGSPIANDFRNAGLSVEDIIFTERTKKDLVDNLSMAMDHGYLGIPNQPETQWLLDELNSYYEWKTDGGRVKWGAPAGKHDDGVTALMLMAWGLRFDWKPPVETPVAVEAESMTASHIHEFTRMRQAWRLAYPTIAPPTSMNALGWESRPKWRHKLVLT